jgi:hypothetical protein
MENQTNTPHPDSHREGIYNSKTLAGIFLLGISFIAFPYWLFSWPVFLIVFAVFIGAKHNFRKTNWMVLLALGFAFLLPNIIPSLSYAVLWPVPMIVIGLFMVLRRKQRWNGSNWEKI